jgi:hypothetical protein
VSDLSLVLPLAFNARIRPNNVNFDNVFDTVAMLS